MHDRTISATTTIAYACWFTGTLLVFLSFFGPLQLAAVGLLIAGAGGVMQIRGFLCALERRERNAFALGKDYERRDRAQVSPIGR